MTEQELQAIKDRHAAATAGSWTQGSEGGVLCVNSQGFLKIVLIPKYDLSPDDLTFIAAAHRDIPALVAEVERLRARQKETPADKEQTEDARVFGDGAWVYCNQHCKPHQTGWCGVGVRDKVALGVDDAQDALQKCRDWGFDLYQDRSAELVICAPAPLPTAQRGAEQLPPLHLHKG